VAVLDAVFLWPAFFTFRRVVEAWNRFESLFDLVGALFLTAWLIGWSVAPLLMTCILLLMLFGREVLVVRRGWLELYLGTGALGLLARYELGKMRNLRFERPPAKSGRSWRGPHFAFDYGASTVAFGSHVEDREITGLHDRIETAGGAVIRRGDARPDELSGAWEPPQPAAGGPPVAGGADAAPDLGPSSPSTVLLVAANLVPVAGAILFDWSLADVMVLYWAESAVIGVFNLAKIAVVGRWAALLAGPFFAGHFGGFMAVHFLFIYTLFVRGAEGGGADGDLAGAIELFVRLWPALLALFISHGFSFFHNFLGRREYRGRSVNQQMTEPYGRIVFMHLVLIFGGGLTLILGGPMLVLLAVIILKILFDVKAHLREHRRPRLSEGV
jgi:hypothetical protein